MIPSLAQFCLRAALLGISAAMAPAALLVNENFDNYTPYNFVTSGSGSIDSGVAASANGLKGNYYVTNAGGSNGFSFQSGGLAFSGYNSSSGGKLVYRPNGGGSTVGVQLDLSAPATGTLYSSFLFQITTSITTATSFSEIRVATGVGDAGGASRFRSQIDNNAGGDGVGTGYTGTGTTTGSATIPALNTVYMAIGVFTNVGNATSVGNPGISTLYILTAAQYDQFALAGFSQSFLDNEANITSRTTNQYIGGATQSFANNNYIQIGGIGTSGGVVNFDALKFGSDLISVVPEPSSASLILLAGCCALVRHRRA